MLYEPLRIAKIGHLHWTKNAAHTYGINNVCIANSQRHTLVQVCTEWQQYTISWTDFTIKPFSYRILEMVARRGRIEQWLFCNEFMSSLQISQNNLFHFYCISIVVEWIMFGVLQWNMKIHDEKNVLGANQFSFITYLWKFYCSTNFLLVICGLVYSILSIAGHVQSTYSMPWTCRSLEMAYPILLCPNA